MIFFKQKSSITIPVRSYQICQILLESTIKIKKQKHILDGKSTRSGHR